MVLPEINSIAEICAQHKIEDVVLSPGSRCAPITIAFNRHPQFSPITLSDERAAAFTALGMSLETDKPSVLVCTSGSAAYNYAPAVAEAFFAQVPLLVITADRPPEWVDQMDGQTIRQSGIFGKHVKKSFDLPVDHQHPDAKWQFNRQVNEAILEANSFPKGPVHLNIPIREPFYPEKGEAIKFDASCRVIKKRSVLNDFSPQVWEELKQEFSLYSKPLIVLGQQKLRADLIESLGQFSSKHQIPVIADGISNFHDLEDVISLPDNILIGNQDKKPLQPDLLITFGASVISKPLKQFLRSYPPNAQWHLEETGMTADTFQCLTEILPVSPATFLQHMKEASTSFSSPYFQLWQQEQKRQREKLQAFVEVSPFTEIKIAHQILNHLPQDSLLHLSNSMTVRNVNFVGIPVQKNIEIACNRGTSGIDGSNSTAIGAAMKTERLTTLITGDMAFFYDRNGLWNNYLPANLRIIVINNHAGGIFGLIQGPREQEELATYFETHQQLKAKNTAEDFNLDYFSCSDFKALNTLLPDFFKASERPKLLEIFVDKEENKSSFDQFKAHLKG
ncbi:2-succinyl-5-enolpyruvyl-6-hydroxy-3-cyclohexene-1-carboxylic-acid synthase [Persicobacter diffluens]|uniref:2-succinyl-5-enolpyruvyl-6-hydroxy-3-cyclohexene-1-carboxylate synthase n=1 Tax=Persicobacter diffluens TaxID=981 RepID=A0AAN5AJ71_9BACT|nr:2-succinyl-5-enolpyruvyl-6-hydroxy-3-cyclohexene- 1-carboxylate synthase [Persicobacter diffluens]